MVLKERKVSP